MTREAAKRWAKEIAHFGNGGDLWSYVTKHKAWVKCTNPIFDFAECKTSFIIEDKYFKMRKAFALGETIEYTIASGSFRDTKNPEWLDCCDYRVKVGKEYRWQWLYTEINCKILQLTLSHYATSGDAMRCLRIEGIYAKKDLRKLEETKKEFKRCQ